MQRPLTVLSVAFPFAQVGADAVGGAEQILASLDRALTERGHRSIVVAQRGSRVTGTLVPLPAFDPTHGREAAWREWRDAIGRTLASERVDVVHLHGLDAHAYFPRHPAVWTLHLPIAAYAPRALELAATFCCVSESQRATCPPAAKVRTIENGVDVAAFEPRLTKGRYALALGRICEEKGYHLAIQAARRAGVPLVIAGRVFDYPAHRRYFEARIRPELGPAVRFLGPVGPRVKRRLLAGARALLVPSLAEETSSLVAMEALASATPVIAFARGALPEIVEHERTGLLTDGAAGMAEALARVDAIDPRACRRAAEARFDAARMHERYLGLYREVAGGGARAVA
ncbi:MAG TPA: glycosyltransferase [Sandaracinaceae bacterium]